MAMVQLQKQHLAPAKATAAGSEQKSMTVFLNYKMDDQQKFQQQLQEIYLTAAKLGEQSSMVNTDLKSISQDLFAQVGININDLGVSPTGFWGLVIVYLYFQIPLMFLVSLPAINGLRRTWREAAAIMGASGARYWVRVGIPILTPAALGGMLLLFVNSFAAYATAYVLNPGGALVPLQIRFLLQGNVISGEEDLGYAIVTWVIGILMASLFLLTWLQRRTLRWTQS